MGLRMWVGVGVGVGVGVVARRRHWCLHYLSAISPLYLRYLSATSPHPIAPIYLRHISRISPPYLAPPPLLSERCAAEAAGDEDIASAWVRGRGRVGVRG